jgi:amino acid efflux transporter
MTDDRAEHHEGKLTRRQGFPLAIGSIAGSGILFLPSAVYARAGHNALVVWAIATLMSLPMLLMFDDMVRSNPDGRGVEAFVRVGLGPTVGRAVPLMYTGLVVVGLPAGTFVAGRYVARALGAPAGVVVAIASAIIVAALVVNFVGLRTSSRVQSVATWGLMVVASALLVSSIPAARLGASTVTPRTDQLGAVLPALILAFWAFSGFENLTFLAREFRDPKRDFLPVCFAALFAYGLFTVLLTIAIALTVPRGSVDQVVGLLQLAATVGYGGALVWAVTVIAVTALLLNSVAWVWGVSNLVRDAATNGSIPAVFARVDHRGVPRHALALLAGLASIGCIVLAIRQDWIIDATAAASAIFMLLYLMTIVSYHRVRGVSWRTLANDALLVIIATSLVESRWVVLYGVFVLVAALALASRPAKE